MVKSEIYKYTDENGVTTFSSQPPAKKEISEEININNTNTLAPLQENNSAEETDTKYKEINDRFRENTIKNKSRREQIKDAKLNVELKKQALEAGKDPLPGEQQGLASGFVRYNDTYHERIQQLEADVEQAEKELKEISRPF